MPTKTWQSGEEIKAADVNQYLQVQAVQVFADAAARTTAVPTPTVGMTSYLISTGALEIFTDKTSPASWRPPWNTSWGLMHNAAVADITWTNSNQFLVPTLPCNLPGRYYKVELDINIAIGAPQAQTATMQFMNGALSGTFGQWAQNQGWWIRACLGEIVIGQTSNDIRIVGRIDFAATTNWGRVRVFDVGPV
jgi:hypothetical protein